MKYAFLDADFVMKAHTIRKDNTNLLIDQILNKEGYQFCCHLQTLQEIKNHNESTYNWYQEQIRINRVSLSETLISVSKTRTTVVFGDRVRRCVDFSCLWIGFSTSVFPGIIKLCSLRVRISFFSHSPST